MRARRGEFDVVVAQFHDQGLIPVKYLGVEQGVNITVGLPFVRTSVDHGTAFDIAGTGRADHASLACALRQAAAMVQATRTGASARTQRPDFIFMLTQQDRTIADARERLREVLAQGVRHVGFKDIGLPLPELHALARTSVRAAPGSIWRLSASTRPAKWPRPARRSTSGWTCSWVAHGPRRCCPCCAAAALRTTRFPAR